MRGLLSRLPARSIQLAVALPSLWLVGGCGARSNVAAVSPGPSAECRVAATPTPRKDTIIVAFAEALSLPDGTTPRTAADAFVFRHVYEQLVWVDCAGRILPPGPAPYRVAGSADQDPLRRSVTVVLQPTSEAYGPVIKVVAAAAADPRDLLDQGADVLLTADAAVVDYATTRPEVTAIALPWHRTYVLLSPARVQQLGIASLQAATPPAAPSSRFLDALARDAVTAEARAAESPFWWDDPARCDIHLPPGDSRVVTAAGLPTRTPSRAKRIVYAESDRTARELAERLIALAGSGSGSRDGGEALALLGQEVDGSRWVAEALPAASLATSLRASDATAYVLALDTKVIDPCGATQTLLNNVPWLAAPGRVPLADVAGAAATVAAEELDLTRALVPLVDTRRRVIVRAGTPELGVGWDGTVHIIPYRRTPRSL